MKAVDELKLINEVVEFWKDGDCDSGEGMFLISTILSIGEPSEEALDWAKKIVEEYENGNND